MANYLVSALCFLLAVTFVASSNVVVPGDWYLYSNSVTSVNYFSSNNSYTQYSVNGNAHVDGTLLITLNVNSFASSYYLSRVVEYRNSFSGTFKQIRVVVNSSGVVPSYNATASYNYGYISITVNKIASDICNNFQNCSTCTLNYSCGWCASTSKCSTGSSSGPQLGICSSQWSWFSSQCPISNTCSSKSTCGACTATSNCGWCSYTNTCMNGTSSGSSSSSYCPTSNWNYYTCPSSGTPCSSHYSCSSCASDSKCGWCPYSSMCQATNSSWTCSDRQDYSSMCYSSYSSGFQLWMLSFIIPVSILLLSVCIACIRCCSAKRTTYVRVPSATVTIATSTPSPNQPFVSNPSYNQAPVHPQPFIQPHYYPQQYPQHPQPIYPSVGGFNTFNNNVNPIQYHHQQQQQQQRPFYPSQQYQQFPGAAPQPNTPATNNNNRGSVTAANQMHTTN